MTANNFVPSAGDFFYTKKRPYRRVVGGMDFLSGTITQERVVEQEDNSYRDEVWKCLGRDDRAVVTEYRRSGILNGHRLILQREQYEFFPVGPEVLRALGLVASEGEAS